MLSIFFYKVGINKTKNLERNKKKKLTVECLQNLIKPSMSVDGANNKKSRHSSKLMLRLPS